ncbi:hypothetical protein TNIN_185961 [Trichonephila inaurata madagascariensis]|uniref:Uncharacterized protein n=1 Tax=Trichonephila inaurata madagascariensis TaxID=2747483 RepID=A0A8X7BWF7_9ARAC|nr:hypothetical protein TNIN_185961 [Trichonephila inaurata madagascariensis]
MNFKLIFIPFCGLQIRKSKDPKSFFGKGWASLSLHFFPRDHWQKGVNATAVSGILVGYPKAATAAPQMVNSLFLLSPEPSRNITLLINSR